ncbi:MAG: hypothetical protein JWO31_1735, partial [Phycisphaerales bacterium]|nr:hypothetical protein [Phycisphaerales bacterium]
PMGPKPPADVAEPGARSAAYLAGAAACPPYAMRPKADAPAWVAKYVEEHKSARPHHCGMLADVGALLAAARAGRVDGAVGPQSHYHWLHRDGTWSYDFHTAKWRSAVVAQLEADLAGYQRRDANMRSQTGTPNVPGSAGLPPIRPFLEPDLDVPLVPAAAAAATKPATRPAVAPATSPATRPAGGRKA